MEELQDHLDNIANLKADLENIKYQIEQETKLAKKAYAELGKEYNLVPKKRENIKPILKLADRDGAEAYNL